MVMGRLPVVSVGPGNASTLLRITGRGFSWSIPGRRRKDADACNLRWLYVHSWALSCATRQGLRMKIQ
jgi:hypothetical protein